MAARLLRIPLPAPVTAAEAATTSSKNDDRASSNNGCSDDERAALANDIETKNSFCYHAIAIGDTVVGNLSSLSEADDAERSVEKDGADVSSPAWQTKFDAPVLTLTSNSSGTVIASATATHVSLLKGHDGSIIATRQITQSNDDQTVMGPGLVFVSLPSNQYGSRNIEQQSAVKDVLVVVCPVQGGDWDTNNVIVISNIDGEALNSSDPQRFREGATNMSIDALCFDSNNAAATLVEGVFISDDAIRFFVAHKSGRISVYDYNVITKQCTFVTNDLINQIGMGTWKYEEQVGMSIDTYLNRGLFLVLAASNKSNEVTSIGWINVLDLSISANYSITVGEKLLSLKPLLSNHSDECVAVAFSTTDTTSRKKRAEPPKVFILQSLLGKMGSGRSQILFTLQTTDPNVRTVEICSPPPMFATEAYSFRFASKSNGVTLNVYKEFIAGQQGKVGTVHYLLSAKNDFDGARRIITEELATCSIYDDVISTPIHKSLVWLWEFRHALSTWNNGASSRDEYQQSLRQLTFGAATGDIQFTENLTAAAEFMLSWPEKGSNSVIAEASSVSLHDIQSTLSIVYSEIKKVTDVLRSSPKQSYLEELCRKFYKRSRAIQGLESVANLDGSQIHLNDAYLEVDSIDGLLSILVSQAAFRSAERLQKSEYGKSLTPDSISSAALCIPLHSDSTKFLPWLCDLVIPSLHIGHPKLDYIRAWTCKAADFYDEEGIFNGIKSSIDLLTAVSKATSKLYVAMNSMPALSMDVMSETLSASNHHRPSVLKVGIIRGRKIRQGRIFSAQRGESASSSTAIEHLENIDHDCVEQKLNAALRLTRARELGMTKDCLTLSNYESKGDQFVVRELVKSALMRTSSDPSTSALVVDSVKQFANDLHVDFDHAMHQYSIELSNSKKDDIPHYLHDAKRLAQWCDSPSVMCLIVLSMLQKALVSIQRPPDLSQIALSAIEAATDDCIKSELKEAARLLSIDYLVRKYCGNGAQEYFRVSNTTHGIRLVQHVCRHVDVDSVLRDVLILCDAFKDISLVNVCVSLLERVTISRGSGRVGQCAHIMTELYTRDASLAEAVGGRTISFCEGVLEDCKKLILQDSFAAEAKRKATQIARVACSILSVMVNEGKLRDVSTNYAGSLLRLKQFEIIARLQKERDIFLTLSESGDPSSSASVVLEVLKPIIAVSLANQSSEESVDNLHREIKPLIRNAKSWCAALCESSKVDKVWSYVVGTIASQITKTSGRNASILLEASGCFESGTHFQSIVAVALTLCNEAILQTHQLSKSMLPNENPSNAVLTAMKNMARASQLLREHVISSSPTDALPTALSVSTLVELVCDVCARSDHGVGERLETEIAHLYPTHQKPTSFCQKVLPPSPILHPTWYIGDGLLLQPTDALLGCISYCQIVSQLEPMGLFSTSNQLVATSEISQMLGANAAHSTCLRLLAHGNSISMSLTGDYLFDYGIVANIKALSAERSLGGTDAGFTSGNIDSLLSVSFLLHLPKERAFKVYQASLPSAIGNRDCARILALASIGSYLGMGSYSSGVHFSWRKQQRFVDQCNDLFRNAIWWNIFSSYDLSFDPSVFSKFSDSSVKKTMQNYCEQLVWKAANSLGSNSVLRLARKFASTFGLDKYSPASALVKFLLSFPLAPDTKSASNESNHDMRYNLIIAEDEARSVLPCMPILNQVKVLRKCVLDLERDECCAKDYDRHAMVLLLYRECLAKLGALMNKSDARRKAHVEEMERIERRQDALVILSSIFDKYTPSERPAYNKMFEPLPEDPSISSRNNSHRVGVIGSFAPSNAFDSLAPLHAVLESMHSSEVLGALDISLCPLLQLPTGYILSRSLILRLNKLITVGEDLPPFEDIVAPVAKKLANSGDKADLALWCSQQYSTGSNDQLKCLDLAYTNATLASDEVESLGNRSDEERDALERVQQIDAARAGLSDKILVEEVLSRHDAANTKMKSLYNDLLRKVHTTISGNAKYSPELLVRELLVHGSLTAALSALDKWDNLSTPGFRSLATIVHDACQLLADKYSHVSVGKIARHLMRQWLAHGDESNISDDIDFCNNPECLETNEEEPMNASARLEDIEETSEFVIDMKMFSSSEQSWTNASNKNSLPTSEEPSSMNPLSSSKERYDQMNSRVALRIAFVTCFAKDYHRQNDITSEEEDENTDNNNSFNKSFLKTKKLRAGLFEGDMAMRHAQELLNIAFAREDNALTSSYRPLFDESVSFDGNNSILSTIQEDHSYIKDDSRGANKAKSFSFAMRHRALRVASILCPHDLLLRVLTEDGLVSKVTDDAINKFTFASFVAAEIEAMGLPLPHSDLVQLSSMNYVSFARTIWRHHGGVSSRSLSGRFYLLLLNLCVNNQTSIDWELFLSIFSELKRLELPRSLLLACECAFQSKALELAISEERGDILSCVGEAVHIISRVVVNEIRSNIEAGLGESMQDCLSTLHRLVSLIIAELIHFDPISLMNDLMALASQYKCENHKKLSQGVREEAERILAHMTDPQKFSAASSTASNNDNEDKSTVQDGECSIPTNSREAVEAFERRFLSCNV